ncbi:hypothetical protein ACVWW1_004017 [Bradyrhizobium sp. JR3.5]
MARHRLEARLAAAGRKHGLGRFQHALAVAHGVGARLADNFW